MFRLKFRLLECLFPRFGSLHLVDRSDLEKYVPDNHPEVCLKNQECVKPTTTLWWPWVSPKQCKTFYSFGVHCSFSLLTNVKFTTLSIPYILGGPTLLTIPGKKVNLRSPRSKAITDSRYSACQMIRVNSNRYADASCANDSNGIGLKFADQQSGFHSLITYL